MIYWWQKSQLLEQHIFSIACMIKHTVENSYEFVELISSTKLGKSESELSFDGVSLFTLAPLETAKTIVAGRVGDDYTMDGRTIRTMLQLMEELSIY